MNTLALNQSSHSSAFLAPLSLEALRERAPAAFAGFGPRKSELCLYVHFHSDGRGRAASGPASTR